MNDFLFVDNCIKIERVKAGISQVELARQCGTTQTTISSIEKGQWSPTVKLALILSAYFGKPVNKLFWLSKD